MGTIDYTAPELVLGKKADHRLDVYSLGCLFYECLAGAPPFPKERDVEVLYAHIQDPAPRITALRPDLPPALDDVIMKAMAKKPEDRFPTCSAFIDAARTIVGEPASGRRASAAAAAARRRCRRGRAAAAPPPPPAPPGPPPSRRRRGCRLRPPSAATPVPTPRPGRLRERAHRRPADPWRPLPAEAILLRVTAGPASGTVLTVREELQIGRQAPGDGKLGNDIEISRRHARVTREGRREFLIEDLGSTNGTFVNGERIAGARVLEPGDKLEMGDTKLTVELPEPIEDKVIQPTGAPPAVTTFAAIPADLPPIGGEPEAAEPEPEPEPAPEPMPAPGARRRRSRRRRSLSRTPEARGTPSPEPEPEPRSPEPEPAPPVPILFASSGPITVRVERGADDELALVLDDGEAPARFVRRGGTWTVDDSGPA